MNRTHARTVQSNEDGDTADLPFVADHETLTAAFVCAVAAGTFALLVLLFALGAML